MEIIYYTKETAPHVPVPYPSRERHRYNTMTPYKDWESEHRRVQALPPDELKKHMEHRQTYYSPPCAACDWDVVQKNPDLAKARVEIKRRVRQFQTKGKLPPGWMLSNGIKFGGAMLSDEQCRKVVIPYPIRYYTTEELRAGKVQFSYLAAEDLIISHVMSKYLEAVGSTRKGKASGEPPYHGARAPEYQKWSCGCLTSIDGVYMIGDPCSKHRRPIKGRDDE